MRLAITVLMLALFVAAAYRSMGRRSTPRRTSFRPGPGTVGTIYDMLNEDKRRAVELIVEEKAEATDPEFVMGKGTKN